MPFDVHLVELEVAVGADHGIDLAREQRRREREVDIDQRHVLDPEAVALEHGAEQRVLEAADRVADRTALEVGDRLDGPVGEHQQRVQRGRYQRRNPHQRQPLGHLQVKLRLVGDCEVRLAGGDQLGRVIGVGRRDELDLDPLIREVALLQRDEEGCVVGVDEPVEHQGELVGRDGRFGANTAAARHRVAATRSVLAILRMCHPPC